MDTLKDKVTYFWYDGVHYKGIETSKGSYFLFCEFKKKWVLIYWGMENKANKANLLKSPFAWGGVPDYNLDFKWFVTHGLEGWEKVKKMLRGEN